MPRKKASKKKALTKAELDYLLDEVELDREVVHRHGLKRFVQLAWHVLEPTTPLKWGWATDAICDHLEAVTRGEIKRLLINVPPGMMKSLLVGVFWPAWEWGPREQPHLRFLGSSYSEAYATRDSRRMRDLVVSDWYQARWGRTVVPAKLGEASFSNKAKGSREGVPISRLTGGRGDRVILDDPHSTEMAESDADRRTVLRIFRESLPSRLTDPENSAIVVIMQRLHTGDVSGEILDEERDYGYTHLMLPMRFEPERRCTTSIGFTDPRTEPGELLFPERFPEAVVQRDERAMGSYATAGQYQQRPAPRGGGIIKEEWLVNRFARRGKDPKMVVQSWDCASKPKERNDPSVCGTFAVFADRIELWDVSIRRQEFPALLRRAKDKYEEFRPNVVLIEDKDAGQQLGQVIKDDKTCKIPVKMINPGTLNKVTRLEAESAFIESGDLWLPEAAPWVAGYIDELTTIPASVHDDQGDMTSQFLKWHREQKKRASKAMPGGPSGSSTWI